MDNESIDRFFDELVAHDWARRVPLDDGRLDHRLTPSGEKEMERRIRGVYAKSDDE